MKSGLRPRLHSLPAILFACAFSTAARAEPDFTVDSIRDLTLPSYSADNLTLQQAVYSLENAVRRRFAHADRFRVTIEAGPPILATRVSLEVSSVSAGDLAEMLAAACDLHAFVDRRGLVLRPALASEQPPFVRHPSSPAIAAAAQPVSSPASSRIQPLPAREIAHRAFKSVVMLQMLDENDEEVAIGTGFIVEGGWVATNAHVLRGANHATLWPIDSRKSIRLPLEGIVSQVTDLALIRLPDSAPPELLTLPLAADKLPVVGDTVFAVGNPQGFEGTFSDGKVSGLRRDGNETYIQITAPISPGSSGGPLLDEQGQVVGIVTATWTGGQNLNFAVPVSALRELMGATH